MEKEDALVVSLREPQVDNIIGFVDGVAIPIMCSSDEEEQATYYNGHMKDTVCNNVFAFRPFGTIMFAFFNHPGSWHDSQVSVLLIAHVVANIGMFALCVDQGFPRGGDLYDKFVGPISKKKRRKLSPITRELILARIEIYISLRQASEWGMRALQGSFTRIKSRLCGQTTTRHKHSSIILLHIYRTGYVT